MLLSVLPPLYELGWITGVLFFTLVPMLVLKIIFSIHLQKLLEAISPQNRKMPPSNVWLLLIPLFALIWNFILVENISKSIEAEYRSRNLPIEPKPTYNLGLAFAIIAICIFLPFASIALLVIGIIYWTKTAEYKKAILDMPPYIEGDSQVFSNL